MTLFPNTWTLHCKKKKYLGLWLNTLWRELEHLEVQNQKSHSAAVILRKKMMKRTKTKEETEKDPPPAEPSGTAPTTEPRSRVSNSNDALFSRQPRRFEPAGMTFRRNPNFTSELLTYQEVKGCRIVWSVTTLSLASAERRVMDSPGGSKRVNVSARSDLNFGESWCTYGWFIGNFDKWSFKLEPVAIAPPPGRSVQEVWYRTGPVCKVWCIFRHKKAKLLSRKRRRRERRRRRPWQRCSLN